MMNHHLSQMQGNQLQQQQQQQQSNHMNPNAGMMNQTMNMNNNNSMQAAHHHQQQQQQQQQHGMVQSGHHGPPMYDHMLQPNQMNGMQKGPSEFIYLNQQHPQQHPHHLNQQMAAQNQYLQQSRNNV